MNITVIAAVAEDNVIGVNGTLPWNYPEDLEHFKETTMNSPVIMGRKTFEDICQKLGGPLPGRKNIVLSNSGFPNPFDIEVCNSLENGFERARTEDTDEVFIIGGESIYEQTISIADKLIITEIPQKIDGDSHFPPISEEWKETNREKRNNLNFVEYKRTNGVTNENTHL